MLYRDSSSRIPYIKGERKEQYTEYDRYRDKTHTHTHTNKRMINQEIRIGRVWRHSKRYPSWTCTKLEECVAWVIFSFYLSTWRLTLTREAVLRKRSTLSDSTVVVHVFLNVISCSILGLGERSRKNQVLGDLFLIFCCLDKHFSSFSVFVLRWYIYIFLVLHSHPNYIISFIHS